MHVCDNNMTIVGKGAIACDPGREEYSVVGMQVGIAERL
jgi:hypothetical protein